jgi:hypothetical protein
MTFAEPGCPAMISELLDCANSDTAKTVRPEIAVTARQIFLEWLRIGIHLVKYARLYGSWQYLR